MLEEIMGEFLTDTQSHLEIIEEDLMGLERNPSDSDLIDDLFRRVHSIKGNAGVLGVMDIYEYGQEFETFLEGVRERKATTPEETDKMFEGLDHLKLQLSKLKGEAPPPTASEVESSEPEQERVGEAGLAAESEQNMAIPEATGEAGQTLATLAQPQKQVVELVGTSKKIKSTTKNEAITFLTFVLCEEKYGIDILCVREIILMEPITPVPNSKSYVSGVMNLRDHVMPVFDLKEKLDILMSETVQTGAEKNIVIVDIDGSTTGLKVGEVTGIITINADKIVEANQFRGSLQTDFVFGIGKTDEGSVILLDAMELCSIDELLY